MATTLSSGIYRINVAGDVQPACLTRDGDNRVTILPPSAQPNREQEVICYFMTSSIISRSPTVLVASHPW
jgi:hypothetical protein